MLAELAGADLNPGNLSMDSVRVAGSKKPHACAQPTPPLLRYANKRRPVDWQAPNDGNFGAVVSVDLA
jgi:hypothetical protein